MTSWNRTLVFAANTAALAGLLGGCSFTYDFGREADSVSPDGVVGTTQRGADDPLGFARIDVAGTQVVRTSQADGDFRIVGLPPGAWSHRFSFDENGDGVSELFAIRHVLQVARDFRDGDSDPNTYDVQLGAVTLNGTGTIGGEITLDGDAITGADVYVVETHAYDDPLTEGVETIAQNNGIVAQGTTDQRGRFFIRDVPAQQDAEGGLEYRLFATYVNADTELAVSEPTVVEVLAGVDSTLNIAVTTPAVPFDDIQVPVQLVNVDTLTEVEIVVFDAGIDTLTQPPLLQTTGAVDDNGQVQVTIPAATPLDIYINTPTVGGALYAQLVLPSTIPLLGPIVFTPHDSCAAAPGVAVAVAPGSDCDGDGVGGLPPLSGNAEDGYTNAIGADDGGDALATWVACAEQCTDGSTGGSLYAATATCTIPEPAAPTSPAAIPGTYDCDNDGDGQFDGFEPLACQVYGAGGDVDGDGVCDAADPFPLCPVGDGGDAESDCNVFPLTVAPVGSPVFFDPDVVPLDPPGLKGYFPSTGDGHTCVVTAGFTVYCFGNNTEGQSGAPPGAPAEVTEPPQKIFAPLDVNAVVRDLSATEISVGGQSSCAIMRADFDTGTDTHENALACWGKLSDNGTVGFGSELTSVVGQLDDRVLSDAISLSVAGDSACAIGRVGSDETGLYCWGTTTGPVDAASMTFIRSPSSVGTNIGVTGFQRVSASSTVTCADTDQGVVCFGDPADGRTGTNAQTAMPVGPTLLQPETRTEDNVTTRLQNVSVSESHVCAIDITKRDDVQGEDEDHGVGELYCWGRNGDDDVLDNRLGIDTFAADGNHTLTTTSLNVPTRAAGFHEWFLRNFGTPANVRDVSTGARHTCVVVDDQPELGPTPNAPVARRAFCFGDNSAGQLEDGQTIADPERAFGPISAPLPEGVEFAEIDHIDAGTDYTCVSFLNGEFKCWGNGVSQPDLEENIPVYRTWLGGASDACDDAANWDPAYLPRQGDWLYFSGTADVVFTAACLDETYGALVVDPSFLGTITVAAGETLKLGEFLLFDGDADAVLEASAATIDLQVALPAPDATVPQLEQARPDFIVNNGTLNVGTLHVRNPGVIVLGINTAVDELDILSTGASTLTLHGQVDTFNLAYDDGGNGISWPGDVANELLAQLRLHPDTGSGVGQLNTSGDGLVTIAPVNNGGFGTGYFQVGPEESQTSATTTEVIDGSSPGSTAELHLAGRLTSVAGVLSFPEATTIPVGGTLVVDGGEITASSSLTIAGTLEYQDGPVSAVDLHIEGDGQLVDGSGGTGSSQIFATVFDAASTTGTVELPRNLTWTNALKLPQHVEAQGGAVTWGATGPPGPTASVFIPGGVHLNDFIVEAPGLSLTFGRDQERCGFEDFLEPTDFYVDGTLRLKGDAAQPLSLEGAIVQGSDGPEEAGFFISPTDTTIIDVSETTTSFAATNRNVFRTIETGGEASRGFSSTCGDGYVDVGGDEECDTTQPSCISCRMSDSGGRGLSTSTWTGNGVTDDWNDSANWNGGVPQYFEEAVVFPAGTSGTVTTPLSASLQSITLESGTNVTLIVDGFIYLPGAFRHDGGEVMLSTDSTLSVGFFRSTAPSPDGTSPAFTIPAAGDGASQLVVRGNAYFGATVDLTNGELVAAQQNDFGFPPLPNPNWVAHNDARLGQMRAAANGTGVSIAFNIGGNPHFDGMDLRSSNGASLFVFSMRQGTPITVDGHFGALAVPSGFTSFDISPTITGNLSVGNGVYADGQYTLAPHPGTVDESTINTSGSVEELVLIAPDTVQTVSGRAFTFDRGIQAQKLTFAGGDITIDSTYTWETPQVLKVLNDAHVSISTNVFSGDFGEAPVIDCLLVDGTDADLLVGGLQKNLDVLDVQIRSGRFHPPQELNARDLMVSSSATYDHRCGEVYIESLDEFNTDPPFFPAGRLDVSGQTFFALGLDTNQDLNRIDWAGGGATTRVLGALYGNHPANPDAGDAIGGRLVSVDGPVMVDAAGIVILQMGEVSGINQVGLGHLGFADSITDSANFEILETCGDNVLDPGEACDDDGGPLDPNDPLAKFGDGCGAACTLEPGFVWDAQSNAPIFPAAIDITLTCGNGVVDRFETEAGVDVGEECDTSAWTGDANVLGPQLQPEFCTNSCTIVPHPAEPSASNRCDGCGPHSCYEANF